MTYRMYGVLIASLSAALVLAAGEASARSAAGARAAVISRPIARPLAVHSFRHHHRGGVFWPGVDGGYYGADGAPVIDNYPQAAMSNDVHYTYTYDVPWDWAHRFPPNVAPSNRPYVSSCTAETVRVPGRGGGEQTVNVTRCY
jgi:hypothetical protein